MNEINNQLEEQLDQVQDQLDLPKSRFSSLRGIPNKVGSAARSVGTHANDCVHNHTWTTMAIAMGLGLAVGMLMGRRA
ncbi:MAG TPA: DUF883 C-terminal domain-containing protein [Methylomirabilota bacterium]|nr:DUF883 C-terminal domain-containing protein [Methylomirabilota bacterium]